MPKVLAIVGVREKIASVKTEVFVKYLSRIVKKGPAAGVGDTIILAVDVETVQLLIIPTHGNLNEMCPLRNRMIELSTKLVSATAE